MLADDFVRPGAKPASNEPKSSAEMHDRGHDAGVRVTLQLRRARRAPTSAFDAAVEYDDARPAAQRDAHQRFGVPNHEERHAQTVEPPADDVRRSEVLGRK